MSPVTPKLLTAEEFVELHGSERVELVDGVVKELPMPKKPHGYVANELAFHLTRHVKEHHLGRVITHDTFILTKRNPDRVRGADVAFWSFDRMPKGGIPDSLDVSPPELVAEVISPSDRWREVQAKLAEYLEAGVNVVALVDPRQATVAVYRSEELPQHFHNSDELVFPDVLPGFAVSLPKLFEDVTR